jgi:hypothetical protein
MANGASMSTFTPLPPVFGNLFRGLVQPVLISREPDHLNGGKPFRRVGNRVTERRQLAHTHQNLNITLSEAEQLGRLDKPIANSCSARHSTDDPHEK